MKQRIATEREVATVSEVLEMAEAAGLAQCSRCERFMVDPGAMFAPPDGVCIECAGSAFAAEACDSCGGRGYIACDDEIQACDHVDGGFDDERARLCFLLDLMQCVPYARELAAAIWVPGDEESS